MKNTLQKTLSALATVSLCFPLFAADVSVGRSTIAQIDDTWQVKSMEDKGVEFTGSAGGKVISETKAFIKKSSTGELLGLLIIRGTSSGLDMTNARMVYNAKCEGNKSYYAKGNTGNNERYRECLWVSKQLKPESTIKTNAPQALELLQNEKITLPLTLAVVRSTYWNGNGSNLSVLAFMAPSFVGQSGEVQETLPEGVQPELALWGQSLQKATKDSVMAIFGKFAMPPIEFKP
jgi:hypothetical protein